MVLTTVPTTALTVHAEDQSVIVDTDDSKPADGQSGSDETGNENGIPGGSNSEQGSGDLNQGGDSGNLNQGGGDDQGDDDGSDQNQVGGNQIIDDGSQNNGGSQIIGNDDNQNNDGDGSQGEGQVPVDTGIATASVEEFDDDISTNEMETAEHVKVIEAQTITGDDGKKTYEKLSDATILYEENCVEDGLVKANDTKIAFTIVPRTGKKVTAVKYFTAESEDKFTGDGSSVSASGPVGALDTVYTIGTNISTLEKNQRVVRIAVTVEDVEYHVTFTDNAPGATAWKKHTTGDYDFAQAGTNITSGGADVKYGESLTFAVKGLNKAAKTNVTANAGSDDLTLSGKDGGTAPNEYVEFTLDPANVKGITSNADDDIAVSLANAPGIDIKASLTGGTEASVTIDGNVTVTTPTLKGTYTTYKKLATTTDTSTYHNEDKVYFAVEVKDEDQYKLVPPTAYFLKTRGSDADKQALTVSPETLRDEDDEAVAAYVISLSDIKLSGTLFVTIGAELDDTKETVKTVSFAANADATAVINNDPVDADHNILGKSKTSAADFYEFDVQAKTGYEVTAIEVETAKIYADKTTATVTETIDTTGEKLAENSALYPFDSKQTFKVLFDGKDEADAEAGTPAKAWTARSVKVTVKTATQTLAADASVRFLSNGNYGTGTNKPQGAYQFTVKEEENKVTYNKETKTATVKAGAEYLEFTVTGAETEPTVTVHGQALAELVEGEGYTYRVPAASLNPNDNVFIGRKSKTVTVNYNTTNTVDVTIKDVKEDIDLSNPEDNATASGYDKKVDATVNVDAEVKISGNIHTGVKSTISAVSYLIGDQTAPTTVPLKADGTFEFNVKATDNVVVFVDKSTDAKLEVSVNGNPETPGEDGVYEVSYADAVTAKILNGSGAEIQLLNANVKDGAKNAETKATINAGRDTATLVFDKKEYNKDLKVTLIALSGETRITKEFTVRTQTQIDGVTYTSDKLKDGALTLDMDTEVRIGVDMAAGNSKMKNLAVAIVGETADKATDTNIANAVSGVNGIKAALENGELVITALPCAANNGKGKAKAARIVLVDSKDADKKVIAGSSIMVSTADASILEKAPVVTTTSTAKNIAVNVTAPEGIVGNDQLILGKVWYKVEVTKPSTTGLDADTKAALDKQFATTAYGVAGNGTKLTTYLWAEPGKTVGREIQVMADEIGTAPNVKSFKGAEVKGIKVTTTLIQTRADIAEEDLASATANTITGGKDESTVDTQKPVYANTEKGTLSLKKGTTTIITGNMNDTVVATPSFGDGASYTYVWPRFVDTKTGIEKGETFGNMEVWYDLAANAVKVHFLNQSGNYINNIDNNTYKDLGVKVIAATEPDGHGVSAVVPLKVVNGIETITATAQPYVKFEGKKVTAKVDIDLNGSNAYKKYAPKTKKVTCEIAPASGVEVLPANIASKVTVDAKGTVTVSKDFVVDKTAANNTFRVKVKADDYAGNEKEAYTSNIVISSESRPMGAALIMKQGKAEDGSLTWAKAEIAASGANAKLEVTKESGEYRLVVLKPDVAANKTSYDLTDSSTYVAYKELDIAPAKGNIYVDPTNGNIVVKKFGKASFTVTDKSDKKNKNVNLKGVQFAATSQNVVLKFAQLDDSTPLTESGFASFDTSINYTGRATTMFGVDVYMKNADGTYSELDVSDAKVNFKKNVKNVTPKKDAEWKKYTGGTTAVYDYLIAVNGNPASVVLSRKGQSNMEYTLTNSNVVSKKAPKLANVNKKQKIAATNMASTITYQVSDKNVPSFEGSYVMLSLDTTKKNPDGAVNAFNVDGVKYLDRAIAIRDGSVFDFKIATDEAGDYNLNAAVGTLSGGVFTQEYADAKITVKVLKAGQVKLKVDGKYSLDPQIASKLPIKYNSAEALAWFANSDYDMSGNKVIDTNRNYAKNAIINNQENHFRDYFEAKEDADGYISTIGIRDDLNAENLAKAVEILKAKKHDDQIGYITVTNGGMQVDVKITLNYKSLEKSLTGKATAGVVRGSNMSVDIKLYNGKDYVAVDSYDMVVPDGFAKPATGFLTVDAEKGISDIHLTGNNVAAGTRKVTLKVKLKSQHTKSDTAVNVTVPIKVEKEDIKNKVDLTKDAKVWTFTHNDFVGPTGAANTPEQGSWKKDVNYTFKSLLSVPEDTPINVASDTSFISFKSDVYKAANTKQVLSVEIDKAKLTAALDKKVQWNKKVTVNATFTYGDATHPTALKEDKVKITLTLPTTPNAAVAEADFKAAEPSIQNLIDILDKHNKANAPADIPANAAALAQYKAASTAEIAGKVKEKVNAVAGSANVAVTVTPNTTTDYAASYTVTVTDPKTPAKPVYTNVFSVTTEKTVAQVISSIDSLKATNWNAVKIDDTVKDLLVLTRDTTDEQYAKMIRDVLKKKNLITENIGITVETVVPDGRKAPTTTDTGYYNVTVKVINKSKAPSDGGYSDNTAVDYAFARMQTASEATDTVNTELTTEATVKKIVDDAWKAVAKPGSKTTDDDFYAAVQKNIIDTANKKLAEGNGSETGNDNVKAVSIEDGSFTMNADQSDGELKAISYTLLLSDATAGAEKSEIALNVSITGQTYAITSMQTVTTFHGDLATADLTIKYTDTAEKAAEAIKAKILKDVSKNPAFDPEDLTVEATANSFVAPSGSKNGAIAVTIKVKGQADVSRTNIIVLANGKDVLVTIPDSDTEAAKKTKTAYAKAESQVRAAMNKEALITKINAAIDNKTDGPIGATEVKKVLEQAAKDALGSDTYKIATSDGSAIIASTGNFNPPADSRTSWEIPAFTVTIAKNDGAGAAELPTDVTTITVSAVRLGKFSKLQSLDEAKAAVTKAVKNGLDIGYIALTEEVDFENDGLNAASITALNSAVEAEIAAKKVITNPLITLAADKDTDVTYAKAADTENYTYKMTNWKLTLDTTPSSTAVDVPVAKLNVLKEANTPKVTEIKIKSVDISDIAAADAKRAVVNVESDNTQFSIDYEVTTTDPAAEIEGFKAVDWSVEKEGGGDVEGVTVEGTDGEYYLNVPLTATGGASHELKLNVTATAKNSQPGQAAATKTAYLTLKFKPTITKFDIEGPTTIELASDRTNSTGATYKAVVEGHHLTADEKKAKWSGTIVGTGLGTYNPSTAGATAVAQATVEFGTAVDAAKLTSKYTVIATLDIVDGVLANDSERVKTLSDVTLTQNKAADAADAAQIELKPDESVAKFEADVPVPGDTTIKRLTVTGKDVSIPLAVTDGEDRTWTYTIANVGTGDLVTLYGAAGTTTANAIKIEKTGKNAKLIITNAVKATDTPDVTYDSDNNPTADGTKKIKITATSAADAATGKGQVVSEITLALVVKQNVSSMKLYQKVDGTSAVDANVTSGDTGVGRIEVAHNGTSGDTIYLQPKFEGAHVDQADAVNPAKITYRLRQNPFASGKVTLTQITAENSKKAAEIAVDSSVNTDGTIVVEASYTSGGVTKKASRAIFVKAAAAVGTMQIDGSNAADITIANTVDADQRKTFTMSGLDSECSTPTWTLTANEAGSNYVTMTSAGEMTIKATKGETGIPAGSYETKVRADWLDENGALQSNEATFNIVVEAKATAIEITEISGGDPDALVTAKDVAAGTATLANTTDGTLTVKAKVKSDRKLSADLEKSLKYTVKNGTQSAGLTQVIDTATDVSNGTITVTIPDDLMAEGTFEVEFSIKAVTNQLADDSSPVKKKVTVTVAAATP